MVMVILLMLESDYCRIEIAGGRREAHHATSLESDYCRIEISGGDASERRTQALESDYCRIEIQTTGTVQAGRPR